MAENKVQFGLKNVYYAVLSSGTYATPVAVTGAVSLSLDSEGETTKFYADDSIFYTSVADNGYSGSLEMARIPDQMLQDVWGFTLGGTSKVLTESNNVEAKPFALLFQIDGDQAETCFVMYNVAAERPSITSETIGETKEPQTQSIDITCSPDANNRVFARTTDLTPSATKSAWFTTVFTEP